jgi:3-methylcrotonyl-CoA carboxylase alpha subunit
MSGDWRNEWVSTEPAEGGLYVFEDGECLTILTRIDGMSGVGSADGDIPAPMPGKVTAVDVATGETVTKGQRLLTLEAMKMEHALTAPFNGVVSELNVETGQQVSEGTVLVRVEPEEK